MTKPAPRKRRKKRPDPTPEQQQRIEYGRQVRERRESMDMSMGELAAQVGVVYTQISNIERGSCSPSLPVYRKLCEVLKVGVPPLMG